MKRKYLEIGTSALITITAILNLTYDNTVSLSFLILIVALYNLQLKLYKDDLEILKYNEYDNYNRYMALTLVINEICKNLNIDFDNILTDAIINNSEFNVLDDIFDDDELLIYNLGEISLNFTKRDIKQIINKNPSIWLEKGGVLEFRFNQNGEYNTCTFINGDETYNLSLIDIKLMIDYIYKTLKEKIKNKSI